MNRYELTYIIDTGLEENARKELIEKYTELIKQDGGEIEKVDETWGKRHLAYPINDMMARMMGMGKPKIKSRKLSHSVLRSEVQNRGLENASSKYLVPAQGLAHTPLKML